MKKRISSIILSIVMLVSLLPVAALAAEVADWSAVTGSQDTAITLTSSVTIPEGTYDLSGKTVTFGGTAIISGSVTITNGTILRGIGNKKALFSGGSGASLTLERITVDGNKELVTAENPLIDISDGGTVNLKADALLTNNKSNGSGEGSAVTVYDGTLNILGGKIANNQCTASTGGSTIKTYYGSNVKMTAGEISGNSNTKHGGAIQVYGRDLINENKIKTTTFTMEGGTISNNTAGGVGGGIAVSNYSQFIMNGGIIVDNATTDSEKRGGGVGFADANTKMSISGNAVISGNTVGGTSANNLYIGKNLCNKVTVGTMDGSANVGVTMASAGVFSTGGASYVAQFTSDNGEYKVSANGNNLQLVAASTTIYTVTYTDNGAFLPNVTFDNVVYGSKAPTYHGTTTRPGYTFGGWYRDSGLTTAWDFENDTITGPTTIYAKWTEKNAVSITETAQTYTWDGNPKSFAISGTPNNEFTVQYNIDDDWTTTAPSAVGTYGVKITRAEDDTYKAYETIITGGLVINAAAPTATAPTAKTGLVYDGNAQALINAGTSDHGHWEYSLNGTSYSSDIPTGTDADTYAVCCRFVPNTGYANIDPVELSVTIDPMAVDEPTVVGSYTYTGSEQTVTLNGFNDSYMTIAGNKKTNAGNYEVVITLDSNHTWNTGSDGRVHWSIGKAALTATASSHTVAYGADVPTYTVSYTSWLKGEETPTTAAALTSAYTTTSNVGEYAVTFETAPVFANYTVTTENGKVTVERAKTAKEPTKTDRTYTGEAQNGYTNAGTHVTLSETSSVTDVGNYQFKATPESNYAWEDGSTDAKTYEWSIGKAEAKITVDQTAIVKTYGEAIVLPTATSTFGEVVCDKTAADLVNVGSYTVTYSVAGTSNYDGDTKTVSVTINQLAVNEPSVTGTYTYTGKEQTATVTGKAVYMTETGDVKGTNAGDYTITYTPDGNHCWADGSDGTVTWSIGKAALTATADSKTVTYGDNAPEYTVTYSGWKNGEEEPTTVPVLTSTYTSTSNVGNYDITFSTPPVFANYSVTTSSGTLTVTKKDITVEITPNGGVYGGTIEPATAEFVGLVSGDTLTPVLTYQGEKYTESTEAPKEAGTYKVTAKLPEEVKSSNYNLTGEVTAEFKITVPADPKENYTVPVESEDTVQVEASIEKGTAEVKEITKDVLEEIVQPEEGKKTTTDTIVIDLSQAKQEVTGIVLTTKSVENLRDVLASDKNEIKTVVIKLSEATVEIDAKTLETIGKESDGNSIRLVVDKTEEKQLNTQQKETLVNYNVDKTFEAYFESNGQRISSFNGGEVVVGIKFTPGEGKNANHFKIYYIDENGKMQKFASKYENGMLKFSTTHFSDYAIVYDEKVEVLLMQGKATGKNAIKLSWNELDNTTKYVVYGNSCGKTAKKLKTVKSNKFTVKKIAGKKLVAHKVYKFYVVAYDAVGNKTTSKTIHFIAANTQGKYANVKSIKAKASTLQLVVGEFGKVGATYKMYSGKKHLGSNHGKALRYISDNPEVVSVSSTGKVLARQAGIATIYIQDVGGRYCKTTVTVVADGTK